MKIFMELLGIARIVTESIKVMYKIFILHIVLSIFKRSACSSAASQAVQSSQALSSRSKTASF